VELPAIVRIGLDETRRHWKLVLATSLLLAVSTLAALVLAGYRAGLASAFSDLDRPYLIVQEADSMVVHGRRVAGVGQRLLAIGLSG
jgi:hypothetical protein